MGHCRARLQPSLLDPSDWVSLFKTFSWLSDASEPWWLVLVVLLYCPSHYGDELSRSLLLIEHRAGHRDEYRAQNAMKIIFHVRNLHSQIAHRYFTVKLH